MPLSAKMRLRRRNGEYSHGGSPPGIRNQLASSAGTGNGSERHRCRPTSARLPHGNFRSCLRRAHHAAFFHSGGRHRAGRDLRPGGCRSRLRPRFRRRRGRAPGPPHLGGLRASGRACPESRRSAGAGRRLRRGGAGPGRYAARNRAPHFAHLLVPAAPRRGAYPDRAGGAGAAIQRQNLRLAPVGMPARARGPRQTGFWYAGVGVRRMERRKPGRLFRGFRVRAISIHQRTICSPVFMATAI